MRRNSGLCLFDSKAQVGSLEECNTLSILYNNHFQNCYKAVLSVNLVTVMKLYIAIYICIIYIMVNCCKVLLFPVTFYQPAQTGTTQQEHTNKHAPKDGPELLDICIGLEGLQLTPV